MLDISKWSSQYQIRAMQDSDIDLILSLMLENEQYYQYCDKRPTRDLVLSDLHVTPPGKDLSSKYYVGYFEREILVAVMDLIEGYPDSNIAYIGFFMMNKHRQGRGIGTQIIEELCVSLKASGFSTIQLGIDKENPQSNHFWKKNGFRILREVEIEGGIILAAERAL